MKTFFLPGEKINSKTAVILGDFDGVHIAHQNLISKGVKYAEENNLVSLIYTFDRSIKKSGIITDNDEKQEIFKALSVDVTVFQRVDESFFGMSPEEFADKILINELNAAKVFAGENYTFGKNKTGNSRMLKEILSKRNVDCEICKLLKDNNCVISTTKIRSLIKNGEIEYAERLLGRPFTIKGKIINGNRLGRTIGFPTANIKPDKNSIVPKFGVYSAKVRVLNKEFNAMVNIGVKPTVGGKEVLAEAHIFDFEKDIYGEIIEIQLQKFIREERKFSSVEELKKQLSADEKTIKYNKTTKKH